MGSSRACLWGGAKGESSHAFGLDQSHVATSKSSGHLEGTSWRLWFHSQPWGFSSPDVKGICLLSWPRTSLVWCPSCSDLALTSAACWTEQRVGLRRAELGFDLCKALPVTPVTLPTVTMLMKPLLKGFQEMSVLQRSCWSCTLTASCLAAPELCSPVLPH